VPLPAAQQLMNLQAREGQPAQVSGWRLRAAAADATPEALDRLADTVFTASGLSSDSWYRKRGHFIRSLEYQRNVIGTVMLLVQAVTVFLVYAVFSTLVVEKRRDIGVLLGLGARRRDILGAFLAAGAVTCVAGGLAGWALGWTILPLLDPLGRLLGFPLFPQDIFYSENTPVSFDPLIPLVFIGAMAVIGLLAVLLPAWRASRIDPVATIREGA
jgi:lipoprotein-releasing system permease protein